MKYFFLTALILFLNGCATIDRYSDKSDFDLDVDKYLAYKAKKAYSLAMDQTGNWVSGYAYGMPIQKIANQTSLEYCETKRKEENIKSPCEIYMQGNTRTRPDA